MNETPVTVTEGAYFCVGDRVTLKSTGETMTVRVVRSNTVFLRRLHWYECLWLRLFALAVWTLAVLVVAWFLAA